MLLDRAVEEVDQVHLQEVQGHGLEVQQAVLGQEVLLAVEAHGQDPVVLQGVGDREEVQLVVEDPGQGQDHQQVVLDQEVGHPEAEVDLDQGVNLDLVVDLDLEVALDRQEAELVAGQDPDQEVDPEVGQGPRQVERAVCKTLLHISKKYRFFS